MPPHREQHSCFDLHVSPVASKSGTRSINYSQVRSKVCGNAEAADMNSNPFTIADPPITGMNPALDEVPFRFSQAPHESQEFLTQSANGVPKELIGTYSAQEHWHPVRELDWWLGYHIEWFTDLGKTVPPELCEALAYALGVTGHVQRMLKVHEAILIRARSETEGLPLSWEAIAAELGVSTSTIHVWKTLPEFVAKLVVAKAAFQEDRTNKVGPGGLPYPGEEWLDPPGEAGWEEEVRFVALEICALIDAEGKRTRSASIRNAMYWMIAWHCTHRRVLQPAVITALGRTLGFDQDSWTARLRRPRQFNAMFYAAQMDVDLAAAGKVASISALSRAAGGVERSEVRRWRHSQIYQLMKREFERGRRRGTSDAPVS
jgi:hypothetical protein